MPQLLTNFPNIKSSWLQQINRAEEPSKLWPLIQAAIKLEHATIPSYLQAYYSIKQGSNKAIAETLKSIVNEEMLHMLIVGNLLTAIGGRPSMNRAGFIPTYPGPLPLSVDNGLVVGLEPFSLKLTREVFMRIELPEYLIDRSIGRFATIGEFYDAILKKIRTFGDKAFVGDRQRQLVNDRWFPEDELFAIQDIDSASRAIEVIKSQGEGSRLSPMDSNGEFAHYYKFEEIVEGRRLVRDPTSPDGYSFKGDLVEFDPNGVLPLIHNPKLSDYPKNSLALSGVVQANVTYSSLLNALSNSFNLETAQKRKDSLAAAIGLMFELSLVIREKVLSQTIQTGPLKGKVAAATFTPMFSILRSPKS